MQLQHLPGAMIGDSAVLRLIDLIYEAALDPVQWPAALIQLSDAIEADVPVFMMQGSHKDEIAGFFPRTDPSALTAYRDYWAYRNPTYEKARDAPPLTLVTPDNTVGREAFKKTRFYNEWWEPAGQGTAGLGVVLPDRLTPTALSFFRRPNADDFTSDETRLFLFAARHFARAVKIAGLVSFADLCQEMTLTFLENEGKAAILVDDRGRVLVATQEANDQFEADGVLCLSDSGVSVASRPGVLEALIASCGTTDTRTVPGGTCIVQGRMGQPVELTVAPLRNPDPDRVLPWFVANRPVAMVVIVDSEREHQRTTAQWRDTYGLTPAEIRLAAELMRGGGRRASANRLGISDATARTHLSNIFTKTGTSRQAELVTVLAGLNNGTGRKGHQNGGR